MSLCDELGAILTKLATYANKDYVVAMKNLSGMIPIKVFGLRMSRIYAILCGIGVECRSAFDPGNFDECKEIASFFGFLWMLKWREGRLQIKSGYSTVDTIVLDCRELAKQLLNIYRKKCRKRIDPKALALAKEIIEEEEQIEVTA